MTIYYVRNDGNDSNTGTTSSTSGAWKTLTKALGATGISGGDTLYIAPGVYRETVTVGFASTGSTTYVYGDPQAVNFSGVTPSSVRITCYTLYDSLSSNFSPSSNTLISVSGKNNILFENLYLEYLSVGLGLSSCNNIQLRKSVLNSYKFYSGYAIQIFQDVTLVPHRFENLISFGGDFTRFEPFTSGVGLSSYMIVRNCLSLGNRYHINDITHTVNNPVTFTNCTLIAFNTWAMGTRVNTVGGFDMYNSLVWAEQYANVCWTGGNRIGYTNCRFYGPSQHYPSDPLKRVECSYGTPGLEFGEQLLNGLSHTQFMSSKNNGVLVGVGTTVGIGTSDLFGYGWQNVVPDIGAYQFRSLNTISSLIPPDKQFESITISPDSTSQSIFLNIGATGIAYNTTGLVAHYTRDNSSPVAITLASQTATGAWTSGGFAEVSSSTAPGLYRLDVPNAALASGASKVIISIRGGGQNGAFHNISLNYTRIPDVESRTFVSGTTSLVEYISVTQSNSGSPLTGLTYQSSGLTAYYVRPGAAPVAITLANQTASGSFSSGGFVAVDNTNMPGLYRIDIPNAVFATGVTKATVYLRGAGNMNPIRIEYK